NSLDVIELDAASHNKVEDVREIRANVGTVAVAGGSRKIYILDEAHMLSRAAGNALLKTLEEPPDHVVFVLATTEPYKLLDTVRSRAQRFDFLPVPVEILIDHLADISQREEFETSADGLASVATHAKGSVRDAMSLLEQVAALGGGSVEAATVARALGLADRDAFGQLAMAISNQDAPAALALVSQLAARGGDLRRFVAEAMGFFRGVFLAQYAPNLEEIADEPSDVLDEWRRYAQLLSAADVFRAVDQLSEALLHLRQGREERLVTEVTLIRLTRPEIAIDAESLNVRLERLEKRVPANGGIAAPAPAPEPAKPVAADPVVKAVAEPKTPTKPAVAPPPQKSEPTEEAAAAAEPTPSASVAPVLPEPDPEETPVAAAKDLDIATYESAWPAIAARIRDLAGPSQHALLLEARPAAVNGSTVVFELPSHLPFHLERLSADTQLHGLLGQAAAEFVGVTTTAEFRADGAGASPKPTPEPTRAPDKDTLVEEDDAAIDPTSLVVDMLDGEIID
ncbi:MAG: hypothetical protein GY926_20400, partial [bacterium]|nr:hypothetical protein [bacterium]